MEWEKVLTSELAIYIYAQIAILIIAKFDKKNIIVKIFKKILDKLETK